MKWSVEAQQILDRFEQEKITVLYHFTCVENLPLIRHMNALCSKQALEEAGNWPVFAPGGNDLSHNLDKINDNWNKCSFNFTPYTPMAYSRKPNMHLCFFVLSPSVAGLEGVLFTNTNATNTSDQRRDTGLKGLQFVDFNAINSEPRPWDREGWVRPVQAEVLVPDRISLDFVLEVRFVSEASMAEGKRLWGNYPQPLFAVNRITFSDNPLSTSPNFPYLGKIFITDESVDNLNMKEVQHSKINFTRSSIDCITLIAYVHVKVGTRVKVVWKPQELIQEFSFQKNGRFIHRFYIQNQYIINGFCSVEYYMNDIRWTTLPFEVRA